MKIRVTPENSKLINGRLYINMSKVHKLNIKLKHFVDYDSFIEFPNIGKLVEYKGEYNRTIKKIK
jgi:hypothetical protein